MWRILTRRALSLALLLPIGCAPKDPPAWLRERGGTGVDFVHVRAGEVRFWMPEISSGGLALLDFDGDGDLDLYCVQGGDLAGALPEPPPNRLFENLGDWRFRDVTARAGVGDTGYGHGCATGDYDGDGDVDLYVANVGANVLYANDGDGTFTDVTRAAGVVDERWSGACAFVDYDRDGDLDLFVANNLAWSPGREQECKSPYGERDYCVPKSYHAPTRDTLYRNEGDGTFTDVSEESGIAAGLGVALGVVVCDLDRDGNVDLYVANDGIANRLWCGDGEGHFTDRGAALGCATDAFGRPEASMGVQVFDAEEDGDWDLFVTHVWKETNTFYEWRRGLFIDATRGTGLGAPGVDRTGFGTGLHDFDQDGLLDVFVANGRVSLWRPFEREDFRYGESNQLFRGLGGARFEELPDGLAEQGPPGASRAAAFGDLDGDGDVDVVVQELGERVRLLENVAEKRGGWIGLRLVGPGGTDALGAEVTVETERGSHRRLAHTSYSYLAANDPRVHVGLGAAREVRAVQVAWPDGTTETFGPLERGAYHLLRRGTGR